MSNIVKHNCKLGFLFSTVILFAGCQSTSDSYSRTCDPLNLANRIKFVEAEYKSIYERNFAIHLVPEEAYKLKIELVNKNIISKVPKLEVTFFSREEQSKDGDIYSSSDYSILCINKKAAELTIKNVEIKIDDKVFHSNSSDHLHELTIYVLEVEGKKVLNYRIDQNLDSIDKTGIKSHNRTHGGGIEN